MTRNSTSQQHQPTIRLTRRRVAASIPATAVVLLATACGGKKNNAPVSTAEATTETATATTAPAKATAAAPATPQVVAATPEASPEAVEATPEAVEATPEAVEATPEAVTVGTDVPMFRGDAARTGAMPGPGPDHDLGVEIQWSYQDERGGTSIAAAADMVVYGSTARYVQALDAVTGEERWRFATTGPISGTPTVVDGVVYAADGIGNQPPSVYAIDAATGELRWQVDAIGRSVTSPAIVEGTLYLGVFDTDADPEGIEDTPEADISQGAESESAISGLWAIDTESGMERWRYQTRGWVYSSPAVADGVVYAGSYDRNVYALDAATGEERWRFETGDRIMATPAVAGGVVYIGSVDHQLYALDAASGEERWRFAANDAISSSAAVVDGTVYVGSNDGNLYALDAATGEQRWLAATDDAIDSSPSLASGTVYVGSHDRNLYAIEATSGETIWKLELGDAVSTSPAVIWGTVYVQDASGVVSAVVAVVPRLVANGAARILREVELRGGPAPTGAVRAMLEPGTMVTLTGNPVTTGTIQWWPVSVDETGRQGWVAADALEPIGLAPTPQS